MTARPSHANNPYDRSNNSQNWQELIEVIRRALRLKALYETCRNFMNLILRMLPHIIGPGVYLFGTRHVLKFNPGASTIARGLEAHIPAQIIPPIVTLVVIIVGVLDFIGMFLGAYITHHLFHLLTRQSKPDRPRKKR